MTETALATKMNIVVVGHVDHGKSTVIGRLLADTKSLPEGKLEQVKADCKRNAKPFEYAFLLDALKDEQAQGITIDSARCFFKSKKREYIIIDAPGHIEFLKNMVSGAARAEAALLTIDANEGVKENSKRHGYLLSMLGIKQIAVIVNKMDLVDYKQSVYKKIVKEYTEFLEKIGVEPSCFIPISAMEGENMTRKSPKMSWFDGKSVLSVLDGFEKEPKKSEKVFRMPVQGIYKFTEGGDDRRIVAGRIEAGTVSVGDEVIFLPSNKRSEIQTIEGFNVPERQQAEAGECFGFTLKDELYINRGDVMCRMDQKLPLVSSLIKIKIFWMGKRPFVYDKEYKLKIGTSKIPVYLKKINQIIDASALKNERKKQIDRHDVAECLLETKTSVAFDLTSDLEATGRFVIVDEYDITGGGIITELVEDDQAEVREQVLERQEKWDFSEVDPAVRAEAYGHRPKMILLTGAADVDKKTIAKLTEKTLFENGSKTYFLGIGNLLRGLSSDTEKNRKTRHEHVRRLGEVGHILMDAGLLALATASNLNDDELRLLQEVISRDQILIVHIGKNDFKHSIVDLHLSEKDSAEANSEKLLQFLKEQNIFVTTV